MRTWKGVFVGWYRSILFKTTVWGQCMVKLFKWIFWGDIKISCNSHLICIQVKGQSSLWVFVTDYLDSDRLSTERKEKECAG